MGSRYAREPFILLGAYFLYYMARHLADDAKPAFENARYLMKVEQSIGIFKEISFQSALLSYETVVHTFNIIYFYGHWPAIVAIGAYLFVTKPQVYTITRNAFLISGAVALVFFILFPVAPPRLATFGIVDTLSWTVPVDYDNSPMVNPYAALPSMHVGWALLIGLGLLLSTQKTMAATDRVRADAGDVAGDDHHRQPLLYRRHLRHDPGRDGVPRGFLAARELGGPAGDCARSFS